MQSGVIVGCGAMGQCHGEAYKTMANVRIIAVVDMDEKKGEALSQKLGCLYAKSLNEFSAVQIDFVDICLPTHLHLLMIRQASMFTKNIICEKPLAVNEEEIKEIEDLVKEKDIHLMVAQVLRFWDTYVSACEMMQNNALGKVNSISCKRRQKKPVWASNNWLTNVSLSGGLIFDLMIHDIDWIVWQKGKPNAVVGNIIPAQDGSHAHAKAQLQYDDFTADLFASWGMPESFPFGSSLEIIGTEKMLTCELSGRMVLWNNEATTEVNIERYDAYQKELQYFVECCETRRNPEKCDVFSVIDSLEVARAVNQSALEGRIVQLREKA